MGYEIDIICKKHKITEYLKNQGIDYATYDGDRYKYRCPLPNHKNDKTPSFFVFDKNDRQDYFCFGCKSAGSIVQLVANYEQITHRESLQKLAQGLNIKIDDVIDGIIRELNQYIDEPSEVDKNENMLAYSIYISNHMYDFLSRVKFNDHDLQIAEKVFALADKSLYTENIKLLQQLADTLPQKTKIRYNEYLNEIKKQEISVLLAKKNNNTIN